jgi:hypothetical protein
LLVLPPSLQYLLLVTCAALCFVVDPQRIEEEVSRCPRLTQTCISRGADNAGADDVSVLDVDDVVGVLCFEMRALSGSPQSSS